MANLTDTLKSMKGFEDNTQKLMRISDAYTNIQTRLNAVNDGLQTQAQLQDKVFSAANRSRESYSKMIDTFTKLQTTAGSAFGSNNETLAFSELMKKSFKLGGSDSATQSAGTDQLIKAMGSGTIKSGDFDVISSSAPMMLQAMETFTGKSKEQLRSMAEEGTLTADILKKSLFAASDNISNKFSNLPMTFAEIWDIIKNTAMEAFGGVFEFINSIIASSEFQTALAAVLAGILAVGSVMDWIISNTTTYFDYIVPILEVIGGVLLGTIISGLWSAAVAAWGMISEFIIANWALILIVTAIVLVVSALGAMGVTAQAVFGYIGGAIGVLIAWFHNIPLAISDLGTWISKTIDKLVGGIVNTVVGAINKIISAISKITGLDIKLLDGYQSTTDGMEYKKREEYKDYSEEYKKGSQKGVNIYNGIEENINSIKNGGSLNFLMDKGFSGTDSLGTQGNPATVQGIGSNGNLAVDMAEEDIQYLRDIAERDYINKFSTATLAPNIQVSFGPVHQEADADKVASRIQTILREQIAVASEGVY